MTDFGADHSFAKGVAKVREHYGIEVSESAVREVTEKHGNEMQIEMEMEARLPEKGVFQLLTEMDGVLLPIVEIVEGEGDKRKRRSSKYSEAKLCLAGQVGSLERRERRWEE